MLATSILLLFIHSIAAQSCALLTRYNDCVNKATLKIMGCESLNSGPLYDYYNCLCSTNQGLHDCYALCADDPTLQLESQTSQINVQSVCLQASQQTPPSTTTSTTASTTTVQPTKTIPFSTLTSSNTTTSSKKPTNISVLTSSCRGKEVAWSFLITFFALV
jgi:hypothetical protein